MINLGQYVAGESPIHHLDPRVKIVGVVLLSPLVFAANPAGIVLISLFLTALTGIARLSLARMTAALRPVAFFMALIFVMHAFLTDGTPLLTLAPLPAALTREGLTQGAYVVWQFACLVIAAAILTMTTLPSDLIGGIERLLRPLARVGIPSQDIAVLISMALRFIPMLLEEYDRLRMAQMARGADFAVGSIVQRSRAVAALTVPLLLSAFRRADELALAMEARGYRRGPRTLLRELKLTKPDFTALAVMAVFALFNGAARMMT